ncbi:MAG: RNA-binding transcriptional accessory protein, partial [Deltaproteobacteria bacterium]|nr:RNA-binding transcriptional accessory protein [Deltaproteobacteria bacterium]
MAEPWIDRIATEVGCRLPQVEQTIALLADGATVPFIARYRKEVTGELDEVAIRTIEERLLYHRELDSRREIILKAIEEQGKLTPELHARILAVRQKNQLEDLYLPYKIKRRTKASVARERGLEPLAVLLLAATDPDLSLEAMATSYVNPENELPDVAAVLEGAGHILAEDFADNADGRALVRQQTWQKGIFCSTVA